MFDSPEMSIAQMNMHCWIQERTRERLEGWKIHLLDHFFNITRLHHVAILGHFSWSSREISTKWLYGHHARDYGGGYTTPADLARDYLHIKYPQRRIRCTTAQWHAAVADRRNPPLYAHPMKLENAAYLDISGAYWQIVRAVGWDCNYLPGKYLGVNSSMTDFPYPAEKLTRLLLVSIGMPGHMSLWTGETLQFVARKSAFINMVMVRLVMDVLNGVAWDMLNEAGAVYAHTDGYILPEANLPLAWDVLSEWGLQAKVKAQGQCDVRSVGCYAFHGGREGSFKTRQYAQNRRGTSIDHTYNPGNSWLRPRFRKCAERAEKEWQILKVMD